MKQELYDEKTKLKTFYACVNQLSDYEKELEEMKNMSRQEFVAHLRRLIDAFLVS